MRPTEALACWLGTDILTPETQFLGLAIGGAVGAPLKIPQNLVSVDMEPTRASFMPDPIEIHSDHRPAA